MQHIDLYSFHCGIIDCFCEMVHAGLKPLALSEPLPSAAECEAYLPFVKTCTKKHHILFYLEPDSFVTNLFPFEKNKGKAHFLFYRDPTVLFTYHEIKQRKQQYVASDSYNAAARREIAFSFGTLLGYPSDGIERLLAENKQPEP